MYIDYEVVIDDTQVTKGLKCVLARLFDEKLTEFLLARQKNEVLP